MRCLAVLPVRGRNRTLSGAGWPSEISSAGGSKTGENWAPATVTGVVSARKMNKRHNGCDGPIFHKEKERKSEGRVYMGEDNGLVLGSQPGTRFINLAPRPARLARDPLAVSCFNPSSAAGSIAGGSSHTTTSTPACLPAR